MAKRSRRQESSLRSRVHEARATRERARIRKYWFAAGLVGALLLLILGAGLYDVLVVQPASPIAVVDGDAIRTDAYQKYVRFIRGQAQARYQQLLAQRQQIGDDPSLAQFKQLIDRNIQDAEAQILSAPQQAFDALVEIELIKDEAASRGIAVSDEQVNEQIQQEVASGKGFLTAPQATGTASAAITATATAAAQPTATPTATPTPTPGVTETQQIEPQPTPTPLHVMTQDEFRLEYTNLLTNLSRQVGWSEEEYRGIVRATLLRRLLQEQFATTVPTTTEQIHARHILLETKEQAEGVLQRVKNGEDFAKLAQDLSKDSSNKPKGGDLGWFPRGAMVKAFEDAAFALKPGDLSPVVETSFGFHIIQMLEGPEVRPLEPGLLRQRQNAALTNWQSERKEQLRRESRLISYYSPAKDPR